MSTVVFSVELTNAIIGHLGRQPWADVAKLMAQINHELQNQPVPENNPSDTQNEAN